jgi:hypothetical protein
VKTSWGESPYQGIPYLDLRSSDVGAAAARPEKILPREINRRRNGPYVVPKSWSCRLAVVLLPQAVEIDSGESLTFVYVTMVTDLAD